jgi:SAM-dependent methyltransferase
MALRRLPDSEWPTPRTDTGPGTNSALQSLTKELAFDPAGWTPEILERVTQLFDGLAPEWHTRRGEERLRPLRDALGRGGIPSGGTCVEVGTGIGLQTPVLSEHFGFVLATDVSGEMLARAPASAGVALVRSDASRLPIRSRSVDSVVAVNMFLFPAEYARVLKPGGSVIFISTYGAGTPIFLPPDDVANALEPFMGPDDALTSGDGVGTWTVVRKAASAEGDAR